MPDSFSSCTNRFIIYKKNSKILSLVFHAGIKVASISEKNTSIFESFNQLPTKKLLKKTQIIITVNQKVTQNYNS